MKFGSPVKTSDGGYGVYLQTKSGLTVKEKRELAADLASGDINIVIGTHAIISQKTQFKALGLAIVDEQHKCASLLRSYIKICPSYSNPLLYAVLLTTGFWIIRYHHIGILLRIINEALCGTADSE